MKKKTKQRTTTTEYSPSSAARQLYICQSFPGKNPPLPSGWIFPPVALTLYTSWWRLGRLYLCLPCFWQPRQGRSPRARVNRERLVLVWLSPSGWWGQCWWWCWCWGRPWARGQCCCWQWRWRGAAWDSSGVTTGPARGWAEHPCTPPVTGRRSSPTTHPYMPLAGSSQSATSPSHTPTHRHTYIGYDSFQDAIDKSVHKSTALQKSFPLIACWTFHSFSCFLQTTFFSSVHFCPALLLGFLFQ